MTSYALPYPLLPYCAINLIREYSKPLTRPNWRKSKPIITTYKMYLEVKYLVYSPLYLTPTKKLHTFILYNIGHTEWYYAYVYIKFYGLCAFLHVYTNDNILNEDGIQDAIHYYRRYKN
jgi:hypothetical protein